LRLQSQTLIFVVTKVPTPKGFRKNFLRTQNIISVLIVATLLQKSLHNRFRVLPSQFLQNQFLRIAEMLTRKFVLLGKIANFITTLFAG
jgi:hypothetical protein